jgi:hypothetical protein
MCFMANVTIKDVDDNDLATVAARANAAGMSTQELLRRLIAREAARPVVPNELAALAAKRRLGRTPMSMVEFNRVRRAAARTS